MIPQEFFDTDDALFKGMSSDADDEDWSNFRQFNEARRAGRGSGQKSKFRSVEQAGTKDSKTEDAKAQRHDVGSSREEPARKKLKQGHNISSPAVSISEKRINPTRASSPAPGITSATDRTSSSKPSSAAEEDLSLPRPIPLTKAALVLLPSPATGSSPVSSRTGSPQPLASPSEERSSKSSLDAEAASTGSKGDLSGLAGPTKRSSTSNVGSRIITKEALLGRSKSKIVQPVNLGTSGKVKSRQPSTSTAKKAKEKQQLSYFELAVDIMNRLSEVVSSKPQVLRGVTLFMITSEPPGKPVGDRTRIRLELVMKHGGKVQPAFDPSTCTHVICDLPKGQTGTKETIKRCLGGRAVDDIPHEIRIVGWDWVTNSINGGALQDQLKAEQDFDDTPDRQGQNEATVADGRDIPVSRLSGPSYDPLSKYHEDAMFGHGDESEDEQPPNESSTGQQGRRGYQCMEIGYKLKGPGPNDHIIDVLLELLRVHEASVSPDDRWRVLAYRKAIGSLQRSHKRITNAEDARRLYGIGEKTADKIAEIISTGKLQRLQYQKSGEYQICQKLIGIYGVGPKTAYGWYQKGVRSLDDVWAGRGGITLNENQKIGLKYYDDLQTRMPREEAAQIYDEIKAADPQDGRTHRGVLSRLLRTLSEKGVITHTLAEPDFSTDGLEAKFMGLCRLNGTSRQRRIDILTVSYHQWGAALLYFTGDDIFNRSMRLLARHKGFSLNQRGLWAGATRDPETGEKVTEGSLVASRTEEEIFKVLGVPWQLPHERVRS
ncbi:hypothetical protein FRC05_004256 [Tulasnella sp. 425]|nr:hypothetical protein FRC05_004256 [Tulasnella sp. 425]